MTQSDTSRSSRSHFVWSGECVRPWLPQFGPPAPRHARLAHQYSFMSLFPSFGLTMMDPAATRARLDPVAGTTRAPQDTAPALGHAATGPGRYPWPHSGSTARRCVPGALKTTGSAPMSSHAPGTCHALARPGAGSLASPAVAAPRSGVSPLAPVANRSAACFSLAPAQRRGTRKVFCATPQPLTVAGWPCQKRLSSNASALRHRW